MAWLVVAPSMRARDLEWQRRIRDVSHDLVRIISHPSYAVRNIPVTPCDFPLCTFGVDLYPYINIFLLSLSLFLLFMCSLILLLTCLRIFFFFNNFLHLAWLLLKNPIRLVIIFLPFNYRFSALFRGDPLCHRPTHAIEQYRSLQIISVLSCRVTD